jgi:hypothetical protein
MHPYQNIKNHEEIGGAGVFMTAVTNSGSLQGRFLNQHPGACRYPVK